MLMFIENNPSMSTHTHSATCGHDHSHDAHAPDSRFERLRKAKEATGFAGGFSLLGRTVQYATYVNSSISAFCSQASGLLT